MFKIRKKHLSRCAAGTGILVLFVALALAVDIYRYGDVSDPDAADAAIILGAAVWQEQPSPVFAERINHGINLYRQGKVKFLVFTGGKGAGDQITESMAASRYAIARGVAARDTFCEMSSRITFENLSGAKQIVELKGWKRVLIVSDPLHMRRSILMARDLGLNAFASPTPSSRYTTWQSKSEFLGRELYFYSQYLISRSLPLPENHPQPMQIQPCQ